jgi:hypothetical protein
MQFRNDKPGKFVAIGLLTMAVALASAASCGGHGKTSGFGPGGGGASSGASGGSGDDGSTSLCLNPPCNGASSGGLGLGDSGGSSSGQLAKSDAGVIFDDCTGTKLLSAATVSQLEAGGAVDSSMNWLYPYDGTVFPGGILPPVLQWSPQSGGAPDGVYLHMKSQLFEYKGCFGKTSPTQLPIPAKDWNAALSQSNGGADQLSVSLTTITGGKVSGPITEHWTIALGSLKGIIYYNTYTSQIAGNNGAVMKLTPGNATPTALLSIPGSASPVPTGPCISCHSVSADGSTMVAQKHAYPGGLAAPGSMSFNLKTTINAMNPTPVATTMADDWGFSAVYPDGSRLLTAGEAASSTSVTALFPVANTNNPGMIGPAANVMYNPATGATITYTGLAVQHAMMPMFSPDGKKIVFNDVDPAPMGHGGHGLVVQDFNPATNTFSNPVVIYNDPNMFPGWPFFTPDSKYVVFAAGGSNFASIPPASFSGVGPVQASASDVAASDLYITCLHSPGTALPLNLANGFRNGKSYLPYGARDEHLNFYPTGSPVAAGGYFWVFFTSRRQYGNVMVDATNNNAVPDPVFHAETKKIWATAVTVDAMEGACQGDPSHPAFLLPGQELVSGNIRAFAALAPCTAMNGTCQSGVDCCGGYCTNGKCGPPPTCSTIDNKCTTDANCCAATPPLRCIAGYCQNVPPPM